MAVNWANRPDEDQDNGGYEHDDSVMSDENSSPKPKPNDTNNDLTSRSDAPNKKVRDTKEKDDLEAQQAQPSYKGGNAGDNQRPNADTRAVNAAAGAMSRLPGALGAAAKAWKGMSGGKKGAIGAGGAVGIVSLIIGAYFAFLPLKLGMLMENMFSHHFLKVTHTYEARQGKILKYYLKDRFEPGFAEKTIKNYDRSAIKNLYSTWRDRKLEAKLSENGYKIEYFQNKPTEKILRITKDGTTLTNADINSAEWTTKEYNILFEKGQSRAQVRQMVDDLYHDSGWFKRLTIKHRLFTLTGIRWHWLDPISQPLNKARIAVRNEFTDWVLNSVIMQKAVVQLLHIFMGDKINPDDLNAKITAELETREAAGEVITRAVIKDVTKTVTKEAVKALAGDGSNPVGWVLLAATVGCATNAAWDHAYPAILHLAKIKTEGEYMAFFSMWQSKLSQLHEGKTNGTSVAASMELLTDDKGRDIGQSNNYLRATGQDVTYKANDNCDDPSELCEQKRPQTMLDKSAIVNFFKYANETDQNLKYLPLLPGNVYQGAVCSIVGVINWAYDGVIGIALKPIEFALKFVPFVSTLTSKGGEWIADNLLVPTINHVLPPVIDADTRGPALANAVAAGADASASNTLRGACGDDKDDDKCKLTAAQNDELSYAAAADQQAAFKNLPFTQKIASFEYPQSLVSHIAVIVPASPRVALAQLARIPQMFANITHFPMLANEFGHLALSWSAPTIAAGGTDPLGVDQYGYTEKCIQNADLEDDTSKYCKDAKGNQLDISKEDHSVECAMLAGSGASDADIEDVCADQIDTGSTDTSTGTDGSADNTGTLPQGSQQQLAKQILANKNISWDSADARLPIEQLAGGAKTVSTYLGRNTDVNTKILQLMLYIAQNHAYRISDITMSDAHWTRDLSCPGSHSLTHCAGAAFDIGYYDGNDLSNTGNNPVAIKLVQNIIPVIPSGSNINMGDSTCGGPFSSKVDKMGKTIISDADACTHVHIALPW